MNASHLAAKQTPFVVDRPYATIVGPVQTTLRSIHNASLAVPARTSRPSVAGPKLYFTDGQRTRDQAAIPKVCTHRATRRR